MIYGYAEYYVIVFRKSITIITAEEAFLASITWKSEENYSFGSLQRGK